jgi:hypothetical protein
MAFLNDTFFKIVLVSSFLFVTGCGGIAKSNVKKGDEAGSSDTASIEPAVFQQRNENPEAKQPSAFRLLSYAMRDKPPSVEEAKEFSAGTKTYSDFLNQWKSSESYNTKLRRYFGELVGVRDSVGFPGTFTLRKNSQGNYFLPAKGDCGATGVSEQTAWWLDRGQTISMCTNAVSEEIKFQSGKQSILCARGGARGMGYVSCGCGPQQILCLPAERLEVANESVRNEISERGFYAYSQSLSWFDFLGGDFFYGNRYLYFVYIYSSGRLIAGELPSDVEMETLLSIPLVSLNRTAFPFPPSVSPVAVRAGVVTAPSFLQEYNNFRSRVRGISERLLCQDVNGGLNTGNISQFLNPGLSKADRVHGEKAGCASCHFPMDNLGTMLLGWDARGIFNGNARTSQIGFSFGVQGEGPSALMKGVVERNPWFHECMAKRAWESLAMGVWNQLPDESRKYFLGASVQGPKSLVDAILASQELASLRK